MPVEKSEEIFGLDQDPREPLGFGNVGRSKSMQPNLQEDSSETEMHFWDKNPGVSFGQVLFQEAMRQVASHFLESSADTK
jgi:hypothetical protein